MTIPNDRSWSTQLLLVGCIWTTKSTTCLLKIVHLFSHMNFSLVPRVYQRCADRNYRGSSKSLPVFEWIWGTPTGFALSSLETTLKNWFETLYHRSGLATWQSLGLILSMVTVGADMVDPVPAQFIAPFRSHPASYRQVTPHGPTLHLLQRLRGGSQVNGMAWARCKNLLIASDLGSIGINVFLV